MNKLILSFAAAAMAIMPMTAFAQTGTNNTANTKCTANKVMTKAAKAEAKAQRAVNQLDSAFSSLNLTDQQKSQIQALNKSFVSARRDYAKNMDNMRETAYRELSRADRAKERQEFYDGMKALNSQYLTNLQAVLTPEQYTQFLQQNYVANNIRPQKAMKKGKGMKGNVSKVKYNGPRPLRGQELDNIQMIDRQLKAMKTKK